MGLRYYRMIQQVESMPAPFGKTMQDELIQITGLLNLPYPDNMTRVVWIEIDKAHDQAPGDLLGVGLAHIFDFTLMEIAQAKLLKQ